MDIVDLNRTAWDAQVERGNRWTIPASSESIAAARRGVWEIVLTPTKPIPKGWLEPIAGRNVLCLASGGGQQAPILAAAGAVVTVLDNSPKQLERDELLAKDHQLRITTVLGDMADLGMFSDGSFDLIVHPVSNCFVPDLKPVWQESFRVLRPGGSLLSGFCNPALYIFDPEVARNSGRLEVKHSLPYSDIEAPESEALLAKGEPIEFSHTLEAQIGGQTAAGFAITGMYEDSDRPEENNPLNKFMPTYVATRAIKPIFHEVVMEERP